MDESLVTTVALLVLTLVALAAWGLSLLGLRSAGARKPVSSTVRSLLLFCAVGSAVVFVYRGLAVHEDWQPVKYHVDGLTLIAALLAGAVWFLHSPSRVPGLAPFALALLAVVLAWAICASRFTLIEFQVHSLWMGVHLATVYLGTIFFAIAAVAGALFLFVQYRLRHKRDLGTSRFASLETTEKLIILASALGFVLLTAGLITGLIITTSEPNTLGDQWWRAPKVVLAAIVWLIYALVMNVRHGTTFRGARAAWLSILGLVLLLAVFALFTRAGTERPLHIGVALPIAPRAEVG